MAKRLRVGIIGAGGIAGLHAEAYSQMPETVAVTAVSDINGQAAEALSGKLGATPYEDYHAMLATDVDAVDICLPHHLHAPVAIEAANAGKHVFVEKPIANTLDEADAMIAACRENHVLLMVDQTKRYQNRHRKLKELLDAGYVGEPILVRGAYLQDITYAWQHMEPERLKGYWKHDGVISGIGIHALDLLRWLIGEAAEVQAVASTSDLIDSERRTEDSGLVLLKFANGCVGDVTVSYVLKHPHLGASWDVMPIEIYGRNGSIRMDEHDTITVAADKLGGEAGPGVFQVQTRPAVGAPRPPAEGMAGAIDHLLDCVLNGTQPLTHGEDARASLELVEAAYQSINEGRAVRLPLQPVAAATRAGGVR